MVFVSNRAKIGLNIANISAGFLNMLSGIWPEIKKNIFVLTSSWKKINKLIKKLIVWFSKVDHHVTKETCDQAFSFYDNVKC